MSRLLALCALLLPFAAAAETVWFEVAEIETERDQSFLVPLSDPEHIAHARALIANGGRPSDDLGGILLAEIRDGGDGFNRDIRDPDQRRWRWHISRVDGFGGLAIELCDGWPGWVEENPPAFIRNTSGFICFWGYTIKSELAAPPKFEINEGLDGIWYNPQTPGQGVTIDVLGEQNLIGLGWFTWANGAPGPARTGEHLWYTALGVVEAGASASNAELFVSSGGVFNVTRSVDSQSTGNVEVEFSDCNTGVLRYSFDTGETGEIPMHRLVRRDGCVR